MRYHTHPFALGSIAVTGVIASLPYALLPDNKTVLWPAYLYAFIACFSATGRDVAHLRGRAVSTYTALFALAVNALFLIMLFAGIYRSYALAENHSPGPQIALYFSTVTWTTLGYGGYSPIENLRLRAAGQAVIGYIFLGLIVGLLIEGATQARARQD